jgi:hypothetical protein
MRRKQCQKNRNDVEHMGGHGERGMEIQDKENDRRRGDTSGDESLSGPYVHGSAPVELSSRTGMDSRSASMEEQSAPMSEFTRQAKLETLFE